MKRWVTIGALGFVGGLGFLLFAGGAEAEPTQTLCALDVDCDDGIFCNGQERCDPARAPKGARGCVKPSGPACKSLPGRPARTCNEALGRCESDCKKDPDHDGDGSSSIPCGGNDCDDADRLRHPGHAEVCDPAGHDEDCDMFTVGVKDDDGDGVNDASCFNTGHLTRAYIAYVSPKYTRNDLPVTTYNGLDCDDTNAALGPGAQVCSPSGGVRVCERAKGSWETGPNVGKGGPPRLGDMRQRQARWVELPCPAGTKCVPQPNGEGVCSKL